MILYLDFNIWQNVKQLTTATESVFLYWIEIFTKTLSFSSWHNPYIYTYMYKSVIAICCLSLGLKNPNQKMAFKEGINTRSWKKDPTREPKDKRRN